MAAPEAIRLSVDGVAFEFKFDGSAWSASCERDYIKYTATNVRFTPLEVRDPAQIRSLFNEHPCKLWRSDDHLILIWSIGILNQEISVRLDMEQLDSTGELRVELRRQRDRIAALEQQLLDQQKDDAKSTAAALPCDKTRVHHIFINLMAEPLIVKFTNEKHEKRVVDYCIENAESLFVADKDSVLIQGVKRCTTLKGIMQYTVVRRELGLHQTSPGLLNVLHAVGFRLKEHSQVLHDGIRRLESAHIAYVCDEFVGVNIFEEDYWGDPRFLRFIRTQTTEYRMVTIRGNATLIYRY